MLTITNCIFCNSTLIKDVRFSNFCMYGCHNSSCKVFDHSRFRVNVVDDKVKRCVLVFEGMVYFIDYDMKKTYVLPLNEKLLQDSPSNLITILFSEDIDPIVFDFVIDLYNIKKFSSRIKEYMVFS
jgi:hypothetical protein